MYSNFWTAIAHLIAFCYNLAKEEAEKVLHDLDFSPENMSTFHENLDLEDFEESIEQFKKPRKSQTRLFFSAVRQVSVFTPICLISQPNENSLGFTVFFPLEIAKTEDPTTGGWLKHISLRKPGEICLISNEIVPEPSKQEHQYIWTKSSYQLVIEEPLEFDVTTDRTQKIPLSLAALLNPTGDLKTALELTLQYENPKPYQPLVIALQASGHSDPILKFLSYSYVYLNNSPLQAIVSLYRPPAEWFMGVKLQEIIQKIFNKNFSRIGQAKVPLA